MPRRFSYYERLSAEDRATYRRSDAVSHIPLPDAAALKPLVARLEEALAGGRRARVAAAVRDLSDALLGQLGVPKVDIHVRQVRPVLDDGELHGLYTWAGDGKPPKLEVWMRTAARAKVVRFRTFLRTLVHELVHHLDVTLLGLDDSFHTEGFFRRESSLVRQLLPTSRRRRATEPTEGRRRAEQLTLF